MPKLLERTAPLRVVVNFNIDAEVVQRLRDYCRQHNVKMSRIVEQLIREYLDTFEDESPPKGIKVHAA